MTIMLAWSAEDAGKIIETYKSYEKKPPDGIMERNDSAPHQKVLDCYYYCYYIYILYIHTLIMLCVSVCAVDQCFNYSEIR